MATKVLFSDKNPISKFSSDTTDKDLGEVRSTMNREVQDYAHRSQLERDELANADRYLSCTTKEEAYSVRDKLIEDVKSTTAKFNEELKDHQAKANNIINNSDSTNKEELLKIQEEYFNGVVKDNTEVLNLDIEAINEGYKSSNIHYDNPTSDEESGNEGGSEDQGGFNDFDF
jgi:hypothetical protein